MLARLRRGEQIDHFETVRRAKDGRQVHISLTVSPVRDARGTVIGASKVARDITERIQAEEALRRAHEELEERVRERTAELSSANESLRVEMAERQRVEQERIQLLTRLVLAQEDERRRIARELHDQLGQQLTALRLTLETLKAQSVERSDLRVQVETLEELARQLDEDVAFRVWELRPAVLAESRLAGGVDELRAHTGRQHFGIRAPTAHRPVDRRAPDVRGRDDDVSPRAGSSEQRREARASGPCGRRARTQRRPCVAHHRGQRRWIRCIQRRDGRRRTWPDRDARARRSGRRRSPDRIDTRPRDDRDRARACRSRPRSRAA